MGDRQAPKAWDRRLCILSRLGLRLSEKESNQGLPEGNLEMRKKGSKFDAGGLLFLLPLVFLAAVIHSLVPTLTSPEVNGYGLGSIVGNV